MTKIHIENPASEQFVETSIGPVPIYKCHCGKYQDASIAELNYEENQLLFEKMACKVCLLRYKNKGGHK